MEIPTVAIEDVYRLGKTMGNRPVIVKFIARMWVKMAFNKVKEFKNINLVIANDRSPEERERRRHLLGYVRDLQAIHIEARLKGDRILIDDKPVNKEIIEKPLSKEKLGGKNRGSSKRGRSPTGSSTPPPSTKDSKRIKARLKISSPKRLETKNMNMNDFLTVKNSEAVGNSNTHKPNATSTGAEKQNEK